MNPLDAISDISSGAILTTMRTIGGFILFDLWWFWGTILSAAIFLAALQRWRRYLYALKNPTTTLEIRISREILRGPKAMENIFANLNAISSNPGTFLERYWDGIFSHWFSFEIASFGGDIRFFIHTPKKFQSMVEAHVYSQYADIEIVELEKDYADIMPAKLKDIYDMNYDLYANEVVLGKADPYPIRTYQEFESMDENQNLDPIAALIENLAKIGEGEHLWIQTLVRPVGDSWAEAGKKLIEKIKADNTEEKTDANGNTRTQTNLDESARESIKAIQKNIAKPAFETVIRYVYFAPEDRFNFHFAHNSVISSLNLYKSHALNYFKKNNSASSLVSPRSFPYYDVEQRRNFRKQRAWNSYRHRAMRDDSSLQAFTITTPYFFNRYSKPIVMNTEELATIYHYPTTAVLTAPFIQRVESRKIGPPAGLSIFPDTGDEQPFTFRVPGDEDDESAAE